ncbi:MAG: 1-acyl-sn-glycerol-3-phosphate acyltransferase [Clostridiales bacterium]|jgi:1-acyl-sn-glycerol-3-phosphate acyltransferase|nr:1-acyl-sn-glycerol-3-phosphate acyltransferase [Clostridiales bacterium]
MKNGILKTYNDEKKPTERSGALFPSVSFVKKNALTVLARALFGAACIVMNCKKEKSRLAEKTDGPCLILSTHGSLLDAVYAGRSILPKYYTGVVAKNVFLQPVIGGLVRKMGFIAKKQFVADIVCIKAIKSALDGGVSVFICPEGKISADGRQGYLSPAIAKLVKWADAPVLFYKTHGSYLAFPRWSKGIRRGKIRVEASLLFSKDELRTLSYDDIYERLKTAFVFNDYEYQEQNRLKFRTRRPAEGIERLLYKCPECGAEFQNLTKKDALTCSSCGNAVRIDLFGAITSLTGGAFFDRPDRWADFQKAALREETARDGFALSERVVLSVEDVDTAKYVKTAKGTLTLNGKGLTFSPSEIFRNDIRAEYFYPLSALPSLAFGNKSVYLGADGAMQSYAFDGGGKACKWHYAVEILYGGAFGESSA